MIVTLTYSKMKIKGGTWKKHTTQVQSLIVNLFIYLHTYIAYIHGYILMNYSFKVIVNNIITNLKKLSSLVSLLDILDIFINKLQYKVKFLVFFFSIWKQLDLGCVSIKGRLFVSRDSNGNTSCTQQLTLVFTITAELTNIIIDYTLTLTWDLQCFMTLGLLEPCMAHKGDWKLFSQALYTFQTCLMC